MAAEVRSEKNDSTSSGGAKAMLPPIGLIARTTDTAFWLDGVAAGKLLIQRCATCGALRHPPRPVCPGCTSFDWDSQESAGLGELYSYAIIHHQTSGAPPVPYTVAVVAVAEGIRMVGRLLDIGDDTPTIGMALKLVLQAAEPGEAVLPHWVPADEQAGA